MPNSILYKDITKYSYWMSTGELPYLSDRTIANYKKMRYHPMCTLGLNFTTLGLTEVPRVVECEDEKIKAICDVMLGRIWKRLLRDAWESLIYGFKPFEIRYAPGDLQYRLPDDDKVYTFNGTLFKQPKALDAEYVRIKVDDTGMLTGFKQDFSMGEVTIKDRKCFVVTHNFESGNYYGISALEPIYSTWYISSINMQFHTRWLERKGTGLFLGRYPVGKQDDGTDNSTVMNEILDSIMEGTTIALPAGYDDGGRPMWDITLLDPGDKTDAFIQFHEYLDKMILRGLVIPERALTQGEVGARASVEAYTDIFITRKQDILDNVVDHISKYLLPHFVQLNFGDKIEVKVSAGRIDDASKENAYNLVTKLVEKDKIEIERKWLVEKTGIPIEEKEAIDIIEEAQAKMGIKPGAEEPEEEENPDEEKAAPDKEKKPVEAKDKGKIKEKDDDMMGEHGHKHLSLGEDRWAAISAREQRFDLAATSTYLTQQSAKFQKALKDALLQQKAKIKAYLEKNIGTGQPWSIADEIEIKIGSIKKAYQDALNAAYQYSYGKLKKIVEQKEEFAARERPFIGFRTSLSSKKLVNDLETAIKHAVSESITRGASNAQVLESFNAAYDTFLEGRLAVIAETEIGFAFGKSNMMYMLDNWREVDNGEIPPEKRIERMEYSAILDDKICDLCESLDGIVVEADSAVMQMYNPPLHYFCRCIWMPITQEEIDDPRVANTDLTINEGTGRPYTSETLTASLGDAINLRTFR
jgi:SPP1 gp7 family putative phage head morphogenesis protein